MTSWLNLSDEQKRTSLEQAAVRSGISAKAIEKDWWVTLMLKALFEIPYAPFFIFKGGTSLSKGWKVIDRLSEDIDIALAPEAFGRAYQPEPTASYVKRLKKEGCEFTSTMIKDALAAQLQFYGLTLEQIQISAAPVSDDFPDTDPQTILISYRSLYPPHPYLADVVKIEFSVRSIKDPFEEIPMQSILWEVFPNKAYEQISFSIKAAHPRKTFLEKLFLLHEKLDGDRALQISLERQSRHLYDLVKMEDGGIADQALEDRALYDALISHRRYWVRQKNIDYDSLQRARLSFVPPKTVIDIFRADYAIMQRAMIYVPYHDFDTLIGRLRVLNKKINGL